MNAVKLKKACEAFMFRRGSRWVAQQVVLMRVGNRSIEFLVKGELGNCITVPVDMREFGKVLMSAA